MDTPQVQPASGGATRRTILRSIAATPFAVVAAQLAAPSLADEPATTVTQAVRWNLHPSSGALVPVDSENRVYSTGIAEIPNARQVQGVVSAGGTYYLSISNGSRRRGYLRTWKEGGSTSPADEAWRLPVGPEDLSCHGGTGRLWACGHVGAQ
ncbi:hypothetical protein AB0I49_21395 [Streptomyces sp. NPDC050617]|uniref:hypothetical protein n=1 Tax=Streptomyces sp. NPDC050617 TaxID=3154628 RepID=UPI00341FE4E2